MTLAALISSADPLLRGLSRFRHQLANHQLDLRRMAAGGLRCDTSTMSAGTWAQGA